MRHAISTILFSVFASSIVTNVNAEGLLDPLNKSKAQHHRGVEGRDLPSLLTNIKEHNRIITDVEFWVSYNGCAANEKACLRYDIVTLKNKDDRKWRFEYNLTRSEYSDAWKDAKNKGMRPLDIEITYFNKPIPNSNPPRYDSLIPIAVVFIENKENYKWSSYSKLTSDELMDKRIKIIEQGKMTLVDLETVREFGKNYSAAIFIKDKKKRDSWYQEISKEQWLGQGLDSLEKGNCPLLINDVPKGYAISWIKDPTCKVKVFTELTVEQLKNKRKNLNKDGYRLFSTERHRNKRRGVIYRKDVEPVRSNG